MCECVFCYEFVYTICVGVFRFQCQATEWPNLIKISVVFLSVSRKMADKLKTDNAHVQMIKNS